MDLSIVLPCLNEEEALPLVLEKALKVLKKMGGKGEIVVVDNGSSDRSIEIAKELGARVILEKRRGYGSALTRGFREAKGKVVVMADCDGTYDLLEVEKLIKKSKAGYDIVLGSRFTGKMSNDAMPFLNRYLGNPFLTGFLNLFFGMKVSDAHTGFRAITKSALKKMALRARGMELASEMVVRAKMENLTIAEVPISYSPRIGSSKLSPLKDAWRHIKFILLYSPTYLFFFPGVVLFLLGTTIVLLLSNSSLFIFGRNFDIHSLTIGGFLAILGLNTISLGMLARAYSSKHLGIKGGWLSREILKRFKVEHGIFAGVLIFLGGLLVLLLILIPWATSGFGSLSSIRQVVLSVILMVSGIQIMFNSLFYGFLEDDN